MSEIPLKPVQIKQPADEFWPAVVENGIMLHAHGPTEDYCNVMCCVVASLAGLTEPEDT